MLLITVLHRTTTPALPYLLTMMSFPPTDVFSLYPWRVCVRVSSLVMSDCLRLFVEFSPPDSSAHRMSQARILEWVAVISFFRGSSRLRDRTQISYIAGRFSTIWAKYFLKFYCKNLNSDLLESSIVSGLICSTEQVLRYKDSRNWYINVF